MSGYGVTDPEQKINLLQHFGGEDLYEAYKMIPAAEKAAVPAAEGVPAQNVYERGVAVLTRKFAPQQNVSLHIYEFREMRQGASETLDKFVGRLTSLANQCNFHDNNFEIKHQLLNKCKSSRLRRKGLCETNWTLQRLLDYGRALEQSDSQASTMEKGTVEELCVKSEKVLNVSGGRKKQMYQNSGARPKEYSGPKCMRCGGRHYANDCPRKDVKCFKCSEVGHFADKCLNKPHRRGERGAERGEHPGGRGGWRPFRGRGRGRGRGRTHYLEEEEEDANVVENDTENWGQMHNINNHSQRNPPVYVDFEVVGEKLTLEVDSGSPRSVISWETYLKMKKTLGPEQCPPLKDKGGLLSTYLGEPIPVLGIWEVPVVYEGNSYTLPLVVTKAYRAPDLMGRDWLDSIKLNWRSVFSIMEKPEPDLLHKYASVFEEKLGKVTSTQARINIDPNSTPKFFKARPVAYALRDKVDLELDRLMADGIIEEVKYSEWAAPIVPVMKSDGSVRICGDYKLTVNAACKTEQYPIPKTEDLLAAVNGGVSFTKLDLSHAYLQIELEESSRQYTTINTHRGLYRYTRLPFGVSSSPAIFERTLEGVLRGIPHTLVRMDDILLTGPTDAKHREVLEEVLKRLDQANIKLNKSKCTFFAPSVDWVGHTVTKDGISPIREKLDAVRDLKSPTNIHELKSLLGLVNYYGKYLRNLATRLEPLHRLLRKEEQWKWGPSQERAVEWIREQLSSDHVLVHYDPQKPIVLACDASPYGVGAVLSHVMPDGSERPVGFASRSLSPAERNYAQIDKEGLAVIFGVKKFHSYVWGREVVITTDHKPLLGLLGEGKAIPPMASTRIVRWALILSAYKYTLKYKPGAQHANADGFSRLPQPVVSSEPQMPPESVLLLNYLETSAPVTATQIKSWTARDPVLSHVLKYVLSGWPNHVDNPELVPYVRRQSELSVQDGCILWGARVIVPPQGRDAILSELHEGHQGMARMKALARSYAWWPSMDSAIEEAVKACDKCQLQRNSPAKAPLHPWEWPQRKWARLHIDYAGPMYGQMFLVLVDAHSKWLEVLPVGPTATSKNTVDKLREVFSTHGLPESIVSDNATVFRSAEFADFTSGNGIKHMFSAPYHPATNGLAERAVQTFKGAMKRMTGDWRTNLSKFLFRYRTTPHATTGRAPCEILMNRLLRTRLDLIHPDTSHKVESAQARQVVNHDTHVKEREFDQGERVYVRDYTRYKAPWIQGRVTARRGPVSYSVQAGEKLMHKHVEQMRTRWSADTQVEDVPQEQDQEPDPPWPDEPVTQPKTVVYQPEETTTEATRAHPPSPVLVRTPRRSQRARKPPDRLDL